jgi:ribosome-associated heat shock protein Hsp15
VIVDHAVIVIAADRASVGIVVPMLRHAVRVQKGNLPVAGVHLSPATSGVKAVAMTGVAIAADLGQGGIASAMIAVAQRSSQRRHLSRPLRRWSMRIVRLPSCRRCATRWLAVVKKRTLRLRVQRELDGRLGYGKRGRLVLEGKIRVNGERVAKPAHTLKAGDAVTIAMRQRVRILRVKGFGLRRGSAALASELFDDLSPPPVKANAVGGDATDAGFRGGADAQRVPGSGRPTKRERRELDRFKSRADE